MAPTADGDSDGLLLSYCLVCSPGWVKRGGCYRHQLNAHIRVDIQHSIPSEATPGANKQMAYTLMSLGAKNFLEVSSSDSSLQRCDLFQTTMNIAL